MTEPLSTPSSLAASSQMTALAAVQSKLSSENDRTTSAASPATDSSATRSAAVNTVPAKSASSASAASAQAGGQPSAADVHKAVKHLQDYFQPEQKVTLQVDHDTGQNVVKIVDSQTKQLILQIPSKEVLAMAQKLREAASPQSASGVLVDKEG